ncbi:MAG: NAD(P)H-hydrate dehydratase [Candidatus Aminicenantes bacterium]|nr:NAD(P)H-hydrate dehydratase [Candidatus Aminicenantes bacterium]
MKICRVEEMRRLDRTAVESYGIREELLMENAGHASYEVIRDEYGVEGKTFAVICGIGNNGGDGLVVARKLHSMGGQPSVFLLGDSKKYTGPARINFDIITRIGIPVKQVKSMSDLASGLGRVDVFVDAMFGTGLTRTVEGLFSDVIDFLNGNSSPIVSLDIPSGINGDTGQVMGTAVVADTTITYGLPKIGNMLYPGFEHGGRLYLTHLSFPWDMTQNDDFLCEINIPPELPPRNPDGHKGYFGDALFVAGAAGYFGAPMFSALSFLKAGGGYSRLASPASITPFIGSAGSEIVFVPMKETAGGSLARNNRDNLLDLGERVQMAVIGPGLGLEEETQALVRDLVEKMDIPVLLDGDGITAVCPDSTFLAGRKSPTILTPHLGEMSRLTGLTIEEIQEDRVTVVRDLAKRLRAIVVCKGAHSLIAHPDGHVFINVSGNSGMATAGSGDVLTGTIAAAFGLGQLIEDAVRTGVFLHGLAGDLAAVDKGEDGLTARDILENLPPALLQYRENYEQLFENHYEALTVI